jgi:hypothetical protein
MNKPLITRVQLATLANEVLGVPVKVSTIEKAAHRGTGPKPAARYGKAFLYDPDEGLAWVRTLTRAVESEAA